MGKRLQTFAAMAIMKTLLMLFNFVFLLTGIAVLAVGIWMEIGLDKYLELSTEFSANAPYILIGTGALIVLVGTLACCCTVKGQPVLLYIYGAFLMVIFVMELGAGVSIYAYRDKILEGFDKGLNQSIASYSPGSAKSNDLDFMQSQFQCCGNKGPGDWNVQQIDKPMDAPKLPESCCKNPKMCDATNDDDIYQEGCFNRVVDFVNSNIGLIGGSAMGVAFFPLVGMLLACCLAKNINKAKYEQMA